MNTEVYFETAHEFASAARSLLENKALLKVLSDLEALYYQEWLNTPAHDIEKLSAVKGRMDGLSAFRDDLRAAISGARIEDFNSRARLQRSNTK